MIGFYIHHSGRGHLSRATAIARALDEPVTGLSSLARPDDWPGGWVRLASDESDMPSDATARDRLHWAPLRHDGLRDRMAAVSHWISEAAPAALVVDISVEVAVLARLHGVPVVTVAMPGSRNDRAHRLGYDISTELIAAWPPRAITLVGGLPSEARERVRSVGGISRFAGRAVPAGSGRQRQRVVVFGGAGGDGFSADLVSRAALDASEWDWVHLGASGTWVADPWAALTDADVVVTHAGESALAEVASARRPAIVVPHERPHGEQHAMARELASGRWPAIVVPHFPGGGWRELLGRARALPGSEWHGWEDGRGAQRTADIVRGVAARSRVA